MMKSILLLILGGVLANNYALTRLLGVTPFLGFSKKSDKILALGLATTAVMLVSELILWPVRTSLLSANGLEYLQVMVSLLVIACVVYLVDLLADRLLHQSLKSYAPILVLNSAVLGLALNNGAAGLSYPESLAAALGVGLGFLAAMPVMSGVLEKINERYVPAPFRGLPIALVAASIISMALMAF